MCRIIPLWREPQKSETSIYLERGGSVSSVLMQIITNHAIPSLLAINAVVKHVRGERHEDCTGLGSGARDPTRKHNRTFPARFRLLALTPFWQISIPWVRSPHGLQYSGWPSLGALSASCLAFLSRGRGPNFLVSAGIVVISGNAGLHQPFFINLD